MYNAESTDQKKVTYGDKIDGFKATIKEITTDKDEALDLEGKEHSDKLIEVADEAYTAKVEIEGKAETLVNSYDADKAEYDKNVVTEAVGKLTAQATALVDDAVDKLEKFEDWSTDSLGLRWEKEVKAEKDYVDKQIAEQKTAIDDATKTAETDAAAAMAVLANVNSALVEINDTIDKLIVKAGNIKTEVAANKTAKTDADKAIASIETQLLGNRATIKGVEELNEDASRAAEFTAMVAELSDKIGKQKQAVNDAYASETLVAAWADSEDGEGNKVEGIKSKLDAISADVAAAREAAQASTANYKAYAEMSKEITRLKG